MLSFFLLEYFNPLKHLLIFIIQQVHVRTFTMQSCKKYTIHQMCY